jgi:glycosyltransferase involved in cell wall biosynthesis
LDTFDQRVSPQGRGLDALRAGRAGTAAAVPVARVPGTIVHFLGEASDNMVGFFGPVTAALAESGLHQAVILLDRPNQRHLLLKLDPSVRLVLVPPDAGRWRSMLALMRLLSAEVQRAPGAAVHLHGIVPSLLGGYAARFLGLSAPLYFTPYGRGLRRPLNGVAAILLWALRPRRGAPARRTITSRPTEVEALRQLTGAPVDLVEGSVSDIFFDTPRHEARRPLIVTASRRGDPRGAALYAQLAVLLGDESLGLGFNWVGSADAESTAQLNAAGVGIFAADDDADRVVHLRSAWLYVALGHATRFPTCLVEAMAMGLPCVALATPQHREVLRHGETGLLYNSEDELLAGIASLVDSLAYRTQLGQAAREEALRRFHRSRFSAALLAAYAATTERTAPLAAGADTL